MADEEEEQPEAPWGPPSGEWVGASGSWSPSSDVARYREGAPLGTGGMGRVVVAEDRVLRREVALKEALGAPDGPEALRLRREARITAALDHPGIVPVYDLGEDAEGRPYYVMRLVRGRSLGQAIAEGNSLPERLPLLRGFLAAVEAVAFAHEAGVVHRDLKPDNILVGPWGETQVMDWGLARTLDDDEWEAVLSRDFRTRAGTILGTPAYMSPEQASGEEVGPGVDVWALGAVLHELLSGQRAFKGPSQRELIAQILSGSRVPLRALVPEIDPGLVAIVDKALARDPAARYPDAGAMARDLARWFEGRGEGARSEPRRRSAWLSALALGFAVVAGAAGMRSSADAPSPIDLGIVQDALVQSARLASGGRDRAEAELLAADALARGEHAGARGLFAAQGLAPLPRLLSSAPLPDCALGRLSGRHGFFACAGASQLSLFALDGALRWQTPLTTPHLEVDPDGSNLVAYNETSNSWLFLDIRHGAVIELQGLRFSLSAPRRGLSRVPGRYLGLNNGRSPLVIASTARNDARVKNYTMCPSLGLEYAAEVEEEGVFFAVCTGGSMVRHDSATGEELPLLPPLGRDSIAWTGAIDDADRRLVLGGVEGDLLLVDLVARERLVDLQLSERMIRAVSISPDGQLLAAVDAAGAAWIVPTGAPEDRYRLPGSFSHLDFDSNESIAAVGGGELQRWTVPVPRVRLRRDLEDGVFALAWGPQGIAVAAGSAQTLDDDGALLSRFSLDALTLPNDTPEPAEVRSVAWEPAGSLLVAGFEVGVRRIRGDEASLVMPQGLEAYTLASGHLLAFNVGRSSPYVLDLNGERLPGLSVPGWYPRGTQLTSNGRIATMLGRDGDLYLAIDGADGAPPTLRPLPAPRGARSAAVNNEGSLLYYTSPEGVNVRAVEEPDEMARLLVPRAGAGALLLSRDERWLFIGTVAGFIEVYSLPDGVLRMQIAAHTRRVSGLAQSSDGLRLASGSWDRTLALWDLSPLQAERSTLVEAARERWMGVARAD